MTHTRTGGRSSPRRGGGGFTLIELLVVIGIIALLIGILLPALSRAKTFAWTGACASNQKQIGYAMQMYATENKTFVPREGKHPFRQEWGSRDGYYYQWPRAFYRYVMTRPPTDPDDPSTTFNQNDLDDTNWRRYTYTEVEAYKDPAHPNKNHQIHYIINGIMLSRDGDQIAPGTDGRHPTSSIDEFMRPDSAMYLASFNDDTENKLYNSVYRMPPPEGIDAIYDVFTIAHINGPDTDPNQNSSNVSRISPWRHGRGSNTLFIDSHVEMREIDTLRNPDSWDDRTYNTAF